MYRAHIHSSCCILGDRGGVGEKGGGSKLANELAGGEDRERQEKR